MGHRRTLPSKGPRARPRGQQNGDLAPEAVGGPGHHRHAVLHSGIESDRTSRGTRAEAQRFAKTLVRPRPSKVNTW